jgi:cytidylate kinase
MIREARAVSKITITIDGPAASGKSTIGAAVAEALGYLYFDTGVMYRAVTQAALARGIPVEDEVAVTRLAEALGIEVLRPTVDDGRQYTVLADAEDITWAIRDAAVDRWVSLVSAYPGVRTALTAQQRRIGAAGGVVMVGRDTGSVVLLEAEVKVYLDATVEERARRRHRELLGRGRDSVYENILADLRRRDQTDSTRAVAPLRVPDGAHVIDSTTLSIGQVTEVVVALVRQYRTR